MFLQSVFELTLILDSNKFGKLFDHAYSDLVSFNEDKFADHTFTSRGFTVLYQDSQYKKKIKIIVNPFRLMDTDKPNIEKMTLKLEKLVSNYFNNKYQLDDFELSGMFLITDIDVRSTQKVFDYLKVLRRIGKVKGFSPSRNDWLDDDNSFCLDGNRTASSF